MFYSPLRYPGGKNRLAKFIAQVCCENNINGHYVEPYAGGASVALYLLIENKVKEITINDYDRSIYAFWYSVLNNTDNLCNLIEKTKVNISSWRKAKKMQQDKEQLDLLNLGFSTFFLNRTNRSGIITAGVIGGVEQKGNYKMDCRFNKKELIKRIRLIAKHKKKINLFNLDALKMIDEIRQLKSTKNMILYFDPPYFLKGATLYMNHYNDEQHAAIADKIKSLKKTHWIVSYDNTPQIKKLYRWASSKEYFLNHYAYQLKKGKEILFYNKKTQIPAKIITNSASSL